MQKAANDFSMAGTNFFLKAFAKAERIYGIINYFK